MLRPIAIHTGKTNITPGGRDYNGNALVTITLCAHRIAPMCIDTDSMEQESRLNNINGPYKLYYPANIYFYKLYSFRRKKKWL